MLVLGLRRRRRPRGVALLLGGDSSNNTMANVVMVIVTIIALVMIMILVITIGWHYLSYRYLSKAASFVSCAFLPVKDHHDLPHASPLLKKACVRQVVLDKWFPLTNSCY